MKMKTDFVVVSHIVRLEPKQEEVKKEENKEAETKKVGE